MSIHFANYPASTLLVGVALAGCATVGSGVGYAQSGGRRATFAWRSSNPVSGSMSASLPDGTNYSGRYCQVTRESRYDDAARFSGWYSGWDETDWGVGPSPDFDARYTDHVVAILSSARGSHMRCSFQLASPSNGMYGGGSGECQLSGEDSIEVRFPPG